MKASVRKQVQEMLEKIPPKSKEGVRLREEFARKGFLSKKELKALTRLVSRSEAA